MPSSWRVFSGDSNSFNTGKQSQFSLELFREWKAQQDEEIGKKGYDPNDPSVEEEHIRFMIRQNMNAYLCYKELDEYTACLQEKKLMRRRDDDVIGMDTRHREGTLHYGAARSTTAAGGEGIQQVGAFDINTNKGINERLCKKTHRNYVKCMGSERNQQILMESAIAGGNINSSSSSSGGDASGGKREGHCRAQQDHLFTCLRVNSEIETKTHEPQCESAYKAALRCGLNHLWNHYWRSLAKVNDLDEYHYYELSRDDVQRQEYMRRVNSSMEKQRVSKAALAEEERKGGYYAEK